jgi:hypothetical protein
LAFWLRGLGDGKLPRVASRSPRRRDAEEVNTDMNPYTIDFSYFELHNIKFEQTDVVQTSLHIG